MAEYTDLVHGHGAWPFLEITAITHRRAPYCHVLLPAARRSTAC